MPISIETPVVHDAPVQDVLAAQAQLSRESLLKALFPYDLGYVKDSGLLDMFYHDPETATDGLVHVLGGEIKMSQEGVPLPGGFHHEPSVPAIWGEPDTDGKYPTHIDIQDGDPHPADGLLMMPYAARVVLGGVQKRVIRRSKTEGVMFIPAENTFFPREYDALAVLQGIRHAYDNRSTREEQLIIPSRGVPRYTSFGPLPLIGGREIPLKLVIEFESDKIISAIPKLPANYADQPKLTQEEMWQHILTPNPKVAKS